MYDKNNVVLTILKSRCLTFANAFFQEDNFLRITIGDRGGLHLLEKLSFICLLNESQSSSECTQDADKENAVVLVTDTQCTSC